MVRLGIARAVLMLGNQMDFGYCAIWIGFHESSHIYIVYMYSTSSVSEWFVFNIMVFTN